MTRLVLATLILVPSLALAQESPLDAGPMVAHTTHDTARIWVQGRGPGKVTVVLYPSGEVGRGVKSSHGPVPFDPQRDHTAVVEVKGLGPAIDVEYEVWVDGQRAPGGPWTFRTLPAPGTGKVRIAFGSCLKPSVVREQPVFDTIAAAKPDVFLWLGDNLYYTDGDLASREKLFRRNRVTRGLPSLRKLLAGSVNLAQWDDHDFGPNNSDRRFPLKKDSRDAFLTYWPNPSAGEGGEGIYTRASLGPVDLFLLDNRWFRSPNRESDSPSKGILGAKQVEWLLRELAASKAPVKVVATAGQFLARYHRYESWKRVTHEQERIVAGIRDAGIQGVLFISGDRHLAEVTRWPATHVGYDLWELTSSPLANRWWPDGGKIPNPEREFVYGDGPNFGWIEADAAARTLTVEIRGVSGKTLWSRSLSELWSAERRKSF